MLKTDQFNKAMCDETIPLFFISYSHFPAKVDGNLRFPQRDQISIAV